MFIPYGFFYHLLHRRASAERTSHHQSAGVGGALSLYQSYHLICTGDGPAAVHLAASTVAVAESTGAAETISCCHVLLQHPGLPRRCCAGAGCTAAQAAGGGSTVTGRGGAGDHPTPSPVCDCGRSRLENMSCTVWRCTDIAVYSCPVIVYWPATISMSWLCCGACQEHQWPQPGS